MTQIGVLIVCLCVRESDTSSVKLNPMKNQCTSRTKCWSRCVVAVEADVNLVFISSVCVMWRMTRNHYERLPSGGLSCYYCCEVSSHLSSLRTGALSTGSPQGMCLGSDVSGDSMKISSILGSLGLKALLYSTAACLSQDLRHVQASSSVRLSFTRNLIAFP